MGFDQAVEVFEELKLIFEQPKPDLARCKTLLDRLKLEMTQFSFLYEATDPRQILLAREALEIATLLSIKLQDIPAFERYVAQLKTYYNDFKYLELPQSQRQYTILGLHLLCLLAQNRISEFHTELELLPIALHQNIHIKQPIQLEQYIMEGSYHKVWKARDDVPADTYNFFMNMLMHTVRDEIAECSEKAYNSLPVQDAKKLLLLSDDSEFTNFVKEKSWKVENGSVVFKKPVVDNTTIPAPSLIHQAVLYAKELERIV